MKFKNERKLLFIKHLKSTDFLNADFISLFKTNLQTHKKV